MDALRAVLPLARVLLALAEHRRDAMVLVRSSSRLAELEVVRGRVVRLDGVESEPLGDTLMRGGALDQARHGEALEHTPPSGPVGEWLVHVGAAARPAVSRALCEQLHARTAALFGWAQPHVTLVALAVPTQHEVSIDLVRPVWDGLFQLARHHAREAQSGRRAETQSRRGERILAQLRAAGVDVDRVLASSVASDALAARALLLLLGAFAERDGDVDSYSLLLRKQREIRRSVSPSELLDLPPRAGPEQARRAFKRLAARLHPDRFHGDAPELFALSSDVLRALSRAEALLRAERRAG
jgi:hypothetical protein